MLGSSSVRLKYCANAMCVFGWEAEYFEGNYRNSVRFVLCTLTVASLAWCIIMAYTVVITTVESLPAYNTDEVEEGGEQDGRQLGVAHAEQMQEGVLDEVASPVPLQLGRAHVLHDVLQAEDAPHLWRKIQDVFRWIYPLNIL